MDKSVSGTFSDKERQELEQLLLRSDRLILWKAEAVNLLRQRGHMFYQSHFNQYPNYQPL